MPRLFLVHGWEGHPRIHWQGWLEIQAKAAGFVVYAPEFPEPYNPVCRDWVAILQREIGTPQKDDFLVGHSLGAIAILRYLETLNGSGKIGGAILVAGFATSLGIRQTESFFEGAVAFERVRKTAQLGFVVINSDNDPYIPWAKASELQQGLNARLLRLNNAGHINTDAGYVELPQALDILKKWARTSV